MYEVGNNSFYTPPLEEENKETIEKNDFINGNDDINIDLQ
jgi:hypothetical protein